MIPKTILFVPAHQRERVAKAQQHGADHLVYDLEDGCPSELRPEGIVNVRQLASVGQSLRLPPPGDPTYSEALRLTKLLQLNAVHARVESPPLTPGWVIIETPRGYTHLREIAEAETTLGLLFGVADSHAMVRCAVGPLPPLRMMVALHARAAGKPCWDGPSTVLPVHEPSVEEEAHEAWRLGYDGKVVIHPGQVEPVRRAFAPSEWDIEVAGCILSEPGWVPPPYVRMAKEWRDG